MVFDGPLADAESCSGFGGGLTIRQEGEDLQFSLREHRATFPLATAAYGLISRRRHVILRQMIVRTCQADLKSRVKADPGRRPAVLEPLHGSRLLLRAAICYQRFDMLCQ